MVTTGLNVLVIGAMGQQGGAVARTLLNKGHRVRAFKRNADSPAAQELAKLGAEVGTEDAGEPTCVGGGILPGPRARRRATG